MLRISNAYKFSHFLRCSIYQQKITRRNLHISSNQLISATNRAKDLQKDDSKKEDSIRKTELPHKNHLKAIFYSEFCIFFVFGFCDNFIMMSIGESLEINLGKLIPHAMLAAAVGNWISDLFGLVSGERVENLMNKHFPSPKMTLEQMNHKKFHNWKHLGRWVGMSVGCLVGALMAWPLLDMEREKK